MRSKLWFGLYVLICVAPFVVSAALVGFAVGYAFGFACWLADAFVTAFRCGFEIGSTRVEYDPLPTPTTQRRGLP